MDDGSSRVECPRCFSALKSATDDAGREMLACPRCKGLYVQQASLAELLTKLSVRMAGEIDDETEVQRRPDRGAIHCCPLCRADTEYYGYMGSNAVMLDSCSACGRVWLDPDELESMARLRARTERRSASAEREMAEVRRTWQQANDAQTIADAAGYHRILRTQLGFHTLGFVSELFGFDNDL